MTIRFRFFLFLLHPFLASVVAHGQGVPPESESVVVTATRSPEEERKKFVLPDGFEFDGDTREDDQAVWRFILRRPPRRPG